MINFEHLLLQCFDRYLLVAACVIYSACMAGVRVCSYIAMKGGGEGEEQENNFNPGMNFFVSSDVLNK